MQLLLLLLFCFLPVHFSYGAGSPMNGNIDRFYVQHAHPRIQEGTNYLGSIILANNNPDGYHVKLISLNGGVLKSTTNLDGETDINYNVSFEEGSGRVGSGVVVNYSVAELIVDHALYETTNQLTDTDISLKLYLTIDQAINPLIMAGTYRDEIKVEYVNVK